MRPVPHAQLTTSSRFRNRELRTSVSEGLPVERSSVRMRARAASAARFRSDDMSCARAIFELDVSSNGFWPRCDNRTEPDRAEGSAGRGCGSHIAQLFEATRTLCGVPRRASRAGPDWTQEEAPSWNSAPAASQGRVDTAIFDRTWRIAATLVDGRKADAARICLAGPATNTNKSSPAVVMADLKRMAEFVRMEVSSFSALTQRRTLATGSMT